MLEDVTREIEEESNYLDYIPRRNDKLEPLDLEVLGFSNFISMSEDQYSALAKVRNIVEQSLRQLSNHLVRQSCVDLGRSDLVEFVDSKLLKKDEKEVRILRRNNPNDQNPKDEETKREINKLRIVKKVIRVGNVAMDILVDGYAVADLVLFTENIPTKALLQQITKLLPECIDKSLNFGVELIEETIRMSGEFLNEKIEINIRLASEKLLETDVPNGFDELSHSGIRRDLQNVRRVDWWTKFGKNVYPMMDQLASLFIWLRGEPHGDPLSCLTEWQLLLTMYFAIGSIDISRLSPSDAVLRIFETLSSGFLQAEIRDPSEQLPVNFLANVDRQKSEKLSDWSGKCVRLIGFEQMEQVFKIDFNNNYSLSETPPPLPEDGAKEQDDGEIEIKTSA